MLIQDQFINQLFEEKMKLCSECAYRIDDERFCLIPKDFERYRKDFLSLGAVGCNCFKQKSQEIDVKFVQEILNNTSLYYEYKVDSFDIDCTLNWMCDIIERKIISSDIITLGESALSSYEGVDIIQFKLPFDKAKILETVRVKGFKLISFDGYYNSGYISVSYKWQDKSLVIKVDDTVDKAKLECELGL